MTSILWKSTKLEKSHGWPYLHGEYAKKDKITDLFCDSMEISDGHFIDCMYSKKSIDG